MRNAIYSLQEESQSIHVNSDPSFQLVQKSFCNRCQLYLQEGLRLTEHLKTCSPMCISKKENPIPYPPSLKKPSKVKAGRYQPVSERRAIADQEIDCIEKKHKQDTTGEESEDYDMVEEKEAADEDYLVVSDDMEEVDSSTPPASFSDSLETLKEHNSPSPDKSETSIYHDTRDQYSWKNSEILFANSLDPILTKSKSSKRSLDGDTPSKHMNDNPSASSSAKLYKRKLSGAHDLKREQPLYNSSKANQEENKLDARKKPKKNALEIPSETVFKGLTITEEDKNKPVCARTRSSRKEIPMDCTTKDEDITSSTKGKGEVIDTLPVEEIKAAPKDVVLENSDNVPVENEENVPMIRAKRGRKSITKAPECPLIQQQLEVINRLRLRRKSSVPKIVEEQQKKPVKVKAAKKKNIPSRKALRIAIPLKTKTQYPDLPSPIHTMTRSKASKSDSLSDKSQSPNQESDKESPIEVLSKEYDQIHQDDLTVLDKVLGEGQVGTVNLATYKGLLVACKSKRSNTRLEPFHYQIQRELKYAADLSVCRYINKYIGWVYCPRYKVEKGVTDVRTRKLYVIQKYIPNGDARSYLDRRESIFHPFEAVQAAICLFSAITDAHSLGIGIVDLKLENFLIDSSGSGWLTDFGSCIEFYEREEVDLEDEEVAWTTNVAAPEMIKSQLFYKASDVFMATLIVAELLTVELSDKQFYSQVLKRRKNGSVQFSSTLLHKRYNAFFPLLELGLSDKPKDRPSAKEMLNDFISLRDKIVC